jgi:hypothetical protein
MNLTVGDRSARGAGTGAGAGQRLSRTGAAGCGGRLAARAHASSFTMPVSARSSRDHAKVQVPALWPPAGALDPCRDDARVAQRDDALGLQPVQARADRAPGAARCSGPAWPPAGRGRVVRPGVAGQAGEHELARAGRPPAAIGRNRARSSALGSPRRSPGTARKMRGPVTRAPAGGLSFGLIHPRPEQFTGDREPPSCPGPVHSRPVADGPAQSSKACEGATPPWVQIPPPPLPVRRHIPRARRELNAMSRTFALVITWQCGDMAYSG